jgi:hypothetical protein
LRFLWSAGELDTFGCLLVVEHICL